MLNYTDLIHFVHKYPFFSHLFAAHVQKCFRYCTLNINGIFLCDKTIVQMRLNHLLYKRELLRLEHFSTF